MNIKDLENKVRLLIEGFKNLKLKVDMIEKNMNGTDSFIKAGRNFITKTESDINKVSQRFEEVKKQHETLCTLYRITPEDEKAKNTDLIFEMFANFVENLNKTMIEEKKKKITDIKSLSVNFGDAPVKALGGLYENQMKSKHIEPSFKKAKTNI